jgi:hypothetical protein
MTTERGRHLAAHPSSPTNGRSSPASGPPGRPRGRPRHGPPPPTTTAKSTPTPPLAQHGLHQPRSPGSDSGRRRAGRGHGGRPRRPRPSQPRGCLPHRRPPRPPGRTPRTRNPRTPDATLDTGAGHLDAQTPAPDTGHRSRGHCPLAPDTGHSHRTLDTRTGRADRVTKARPASAPPGPLRPAAARWDAQPCSCGQRLRRLATMTAAVGSSASARLPLALPVICSVAPPAKPRLGALLSCVGFG